MSFRATFLILAASVVFHIAFWLTLGLLLGYGICAQIDKSLGAKARRNAIDAILELEIDGWKADPEDPDYEVNGEIARKKIAACDQLLVCRVAQLLRRMLTV